MYSERINQLKKELIKQSVDIAFITSPINIFYLTGFKSDPMERFYALTISLKDDRSKLFLPVLDLQSAKEHNLDYELIAIADEEDPYKILKKEIGINFKHFGLEKDLVTIQEQESILTTFPELQFIDISKTIMNLRLVKSEKEVEHVKKAISITDEALSRLLKNPVLGRTEKEISQELSEHIRDLGADRPANPLVLSGKRAALPHGGPSDKKIVKGDYLLIDIGAVINGYHSDVTRTFVVGEASEEHERVYWTVNEAIKLSIDKLEVGKKLSSIDLVARNHITKAGYGEFFNHRIGHGLGLEIHETPSIHSNNEDLIAPGMLITIEPGIYNPEFGGVRIEDVVYIDHDGKVERISLFCRDLQVID